MEAVKSGETRVYLSRSTVIANLVLYTIISAALSWALSVLTYDVSIGYFMFVLITLFFYCVAIKQAYNLMAHKPQIIISSEGVQLPPSETDSWDKIERIKFERVNRPRGGVRITLLYTVLKKDETRVDREIDITNFDINKLQIKDLLNNYRLQFYVHTKKEIHSLPGLTDGEDNDINRNL